MKIIKEKYDNVYACDFETYVPEESLELNENIEDIKTWVWSACYVCLNGNETPVIKSNIESMLKDISIDCLLKKHKTARLYFHNLKFDGTFILTWLLNNNRKFVKYNNVGDNGKEFLDTNRMTQQEYSCVISDMGQYYKIIFKYNDVTFTILDSLKLIPMSLDKASSKKGFDTKHKKLKMEYSGAKSVQELTQEDKAYIQNDVYALKECLLAVFKEGLTKITIGACCMSDFKATMDAQTYESRFPDLTLIELPIESGSVNADEYIRKSYRGGWTYCNPKIANALLYNGEVYDANSLYPSVMIANLYPIGKPTYIDLRKEVDEKWYRRFDKDEFYYFIRFKCKFKIKEKHYPFIQIKNNPMYKSNEMLETSDILFNGKKYNSFKVGNEVFDSLVELTLTKTDFILFKESYHIYEYEPLDMLMFWTEENIFYDYVNKWRKVKIENNDNPCKRQIAKLMLNNSYGKLCTSVDSSYKVPYINDKGVLSYNTVHEYNKRAGYIACGSAITSYARNETIRKANANYNNFAYADTDSLHLYDFEDKQPKGLYIHDTAFGGWKNETSWKSGLFVRQKTYIEYTNKKDGKEIEPFYKICCAGMTSSAMNEFLEQLNNMQATMEDFKVGLTLTKNLKPVQVKGGTLLMNKEFKLR